MSHRFRDIKPQKFRSHDLDRLGTRDVIGHVTIRAALPQRAVSYRWPINTNPPTPNDCAKFHQIRFKIATVGAMTDRQTDRQTDAGDLIICPMLCYSNGTDK